MRIDLSDEAIRSKAMADPPRLTETRCQMGRSEKTAGPDGSNSEMKSEFETWPATPVEASLEINEVTLRLVTSRSCFFLTNGAAGVGRPFEKSRGQRSDVRGQRQIHADSDF